MWQSWIAGIMVAIAAAYALWYWMPAVLRRRLARIEKRLGEKPGCASCSSCGGCAPKKPAKAAPGSTGERQPLWLKPRR